MLPLLEQEVNEKAIAHISETMEMLRGIWGYMAVEAERHYKNVVIEGSGEILILKEKFDVIPEVFKGSVIKEGIERLAEAKRDIHAFHISSVRELMEKQPGRKADLPYEITAVRCYEGVRLFRGTKEKEKRIWEERRLDFSKDGEIRAKDIRLSYRTISPKKMPKDESEKTYTKCFDYDIMRGNIVVRTRRPGDYITIGRDGKKQKLKSYFINEKIPKEERDSILLLAEGSHVLWVIGYRRGYAYHIEDKTKKMVEIKIDKGETEYGRDN